jgi:hypothetical protein
MVLTSLSKIHIDDGTKGETGIELSGNGILGIDYSFAFVDTGTLRVGKMKNFVGP